MHQHSSQPPSAEASSIMKVKVKSLSLFQLFATPWTVAHQASLSMAFSRQEYWTGFPFPSPGDLPDPGIEPRSPALQADALQSEPPGKPIKETLKERERRVCVAVGICGELRFWKGHQGRPP